MGSGRIRTFYPRNFILKLSHEIQPEEAAGISNIISGWGPDNTGVIMPEDYLGNLYISIPAIRLS